MQVYRDVSSPNKFRTESFRVNCLVYSGMIRFEQLSLGYWYEIERNILDITVIDTSACLVTLKYKATFFGQKIPVRNQCSWDEKARYSTFSALRVTGMENCLYDPDKIATILNDRTSVGHNLHKLS